MQRPVMNPDFFDETDVDRTPARWRRALWAAWRAARWMGALAVRRPFSRRHNRPPAPWPYRLALGLFYRTVAGLVLLMLTLATLMMGATHPRSAAGGADPGSRGLYYDPVSFLSRDGMRLDAWLIPALDARRILQEQNRALLGRQPAVILVHDYGRSRSQMLPLVKPLHDAGFLVLAMNLRGCGSGASSPQTFGLREWMDVTAAAEMLRRRPFVDADRIDAVGLGSGATAIILAQRNGANFRATVVQNPVTNFRQALDRYVLPPALQRGWVDDLFRWTFTGMYQIDPQKLDEAANTETGADANMLRLSGGLPSNAATIKQVCQYLGETIGG